MAGGAFLCLVGGVRGGELGPVPQGVEVHLVGFVAAQAQGDFDLGAVVRLVGDAIGEQKGGGPAMGAGAGFEVRPQALHQGGRAVEFGDDLLAGGGFPVELGEGLGFGAEVLLKAHAAHPQDVDVVGADGLALAGLQVHRLVRAQGQHAQVHLVVGAPRALDVVEEDYCIPFASHSADHIPAGTLLQMQASASGLPRGTR